MSDWRYERRRYDVVTIPVVWLTIVLSLLIHTAALTILLPRMRLMSPESPELGNLASSLAVQLTPPAAPATTQPSTPAASAPSAAPPTPPMIARAPATRIAPPRREIRRPPSAPPAIALERPAPAIAPPAPAPQPPEPQPTPAAQPPLEGDLGSYVEARRRARGESQPSLASAANAPPGEDENQRRNRIVAANLGTNKPQTFGYDPKKSAGGMFLVEHVDENYADFYFYGMDKDIGRNAKQLIEVTKGDNSNIRIAVVRKMIAIIRQNVSGDFTWISQRQGRSVLLSARPADNAALEEFILQDVFSEGRVPG